MNKKLTFTVEPFRHRYPVFAIGFVGSREFVVSLWVVDFRLQWGN